MPATKSESATATVVRERSREGERGSRRMRIAISDGAGVGAHAASRQAKAAHDFVFPLFLSLSFPRRCIRCSAVQSQSEAESDRSLIALFRHQHQNHYCSHIMMMMIMR